MLELHRVPDEEHGRVVADHVVVAVRGVELDREASRVAPRVGAAPLAGHRGEPDQQVGVSPRLEEGGLGVGAHVTGGLEVAERATALGVRLPLGDPLPVEVRHLLDQVMILKQNRAIRPHRERELVALDRSAGIRSGPKGLVLSHASVLSFLLRADDEPSAVRGGVRVLIEVPCAVACGCLSRCRARWRAGAYRATPAPRIAARSLAVPLHAASRPPRRCWPCPPYPSSFPLGPLITRLTVRLSLTSRRSHQLDPIRAARDSRSPAATSTPSGGGGAVPSGPHSLGRGR